MKQKLIFITKIYPGKFYTEDKTFHLKLSKMLYYNVFYSYQIHIV